jgi:hypothetical protein
MVIQERQLNFFDATYEALVKFLDTVDKHETIPRKKLRNRLINIGLREFLEVVDAENGEKRLALQELGFPFKFLEQLDEAILALAHYLIRLKDEGGTLKVFALNRLSKGEDKNLSYWQSEKARLYIELQNLILLLNDVRDDASQPKRHSEVLRVMTFRNIDDIAFLTQPAINVISEQLAIGIQIGFLFLNETKQVKLPESLSNTLIIDYEPHVKDTSHRFNFYALYRVLSDAKPHALPYQDQCKTKWYTNREEAVACDSRLSGLMKLFEEPWLELTNTNQHSVCKYEAESDEFFNNTTVLMYRAFQGSSVSESYGLAGSNDSHKAFIDRLNQTVVTNDFIRLERAMSAFAYSDKIFAVDATSVKDSLKIHESTPIYRHWIRNTLNRVLRSNDRALERIYILRDTEGDANVEFQSFKKQMQYYFDYLHFDISEVTSIVNAHNPNEPQASVDHKNPPWFCEKWGSLENRVGMYVTTSKVLEHFNSTVMSNAVHPKMLAEVLSEAQPQFHHAHRLLRRLDYLFTERMLYNFKNELADPSELQFQAYLYRSSESFDLATEKRILFDFVKDPNMPKLKTAQTQHRLAALAESIVDYHDQFGDVLAKVYEHDGENDQYNKDRSALEELQAIGDKEFPLAFITKVLEVRHRFEEKLYSYFEPRMSHLYELLKLQSVKIDFFGHPNDFLIDNVKPFTESADMEGLRKFITKEIEDKLKTSRPPAFVDPWRQPEQPIEEKPVNPFD